MIYLDSAATTRRPVEVIEAIADFYRHDNANPAATLHALARRAHERYEGARATVAGFVGAGDPEEIVFTRGTTEAINLVATAWSERWLGPGDTVLVGLGEHASNMVPWQLAARRHGARVAYVGLDGEGLLRLDDLDAALARGPRLLAFAHVSNVLGRINPAREICARARAAGAAVLVDAAQSVPHFPVDVREIGCDFLAFSAHKMLGPMGIGVLWARRELLDALPPYQGGSNMAHGADLDPATLDAHFATGAHRFGAGTPNVAGAVGLAAAIVARMLQRLLAVPGLRLVGAPAASGRVPVFSFAFDGMTGPEVASALDRDGIAIRGGDLASLPLLRHFGLATAARASAYVYTTPEDVDRFGEALERLARWRR